MKIVFLSRYQNSAHRGAETFVAELTKRLPFSFTVDIFSGVDADSLAKVLRGNYDVVIPINGRIQSLKVSLGRIIGKYKLLISGHSGIGRDDIWNIVVARPDVFVALTDYMADWAKKWAWGSKVVKIPNGIDLARFKPGGKRMNFNLPKPIILSVGALTWYKHHERAVEAVAKLGKGSLLIVGSGIEENKLRRLAMQKLPNRFKIMAVPYEEMPKVYRSADLFTLPSWDREAFGIVYLEAMASGLPVVAPNDPPRQEVVGKAGFLVDVTDFEQYAKAIQEALNASWGNKPRQQAEKFSWDIVSKQYKEIFQQMYHE